jgi:allantoinase
VFAGLSHTKGKIAKGYQADLVVWDPRGSFVLEPQDLRFKHKLSPYLGKSLQGRVLYTYLRGQLAYAEGQIVENPTGKALLFRNSKGQM